MQDTKVKDAVDQVRVAAQELYKAISDAAAKTGGAAKADLQAVPQKAKAAADSIKGWVQLACELQRDWARKDTVPAFLDVFISTGGTMGLGLSFG